MEHLVEWVSAGEIEVPAPESRCPPHDLIWDRTRVAAAGSRRLTASAMARPINKKLFPLLQFYQWGLLLHVSSSPVPSLCVVTRATKTDRFVREAASCSYLSLDNLISQYSMWIHEVIPEEEPHDLVNCWIIRWLQMKPVIIDVSRYLCLCHTLHLG
jgi:hypothetical protein